MKRKNKSSRYKSFVKIITALAAAFIVILLTQDLFFTFVPIRQLEQKIYDSKFTRRGAENIQNNSHIIILEITQDSYDQIPAPYNIWPWPRSIFAHLIENLNEAGVKAIGIDIVMSNQDQFSENNDSLLFNTIKKYKNVVVGGAVDIVGESQVSNLNSGGSGGVVIKQNYNYNNIFFTADSSIGIVQVQNDYDGVFRRYRPYIYSSLTNEKKIPSFGFAVLNKYYGLNSLYTAENYDEYFLLANKVIPKFDESHMLINFYGPARTFPHYKLIDVLDDKDFKTTDEIDFEEDINTWDNPDYGILHTGVFKDKIVIIGSTMPEDKDTFPVAISKVERKGDNLIYGVELHANAVENVIRSDFIEIQPRYQRITQITLLAVIAFFFTSFLKEKKIKRQSLLEILNVLLLLAFIYGIYELSFYVFVNYDFHVRIIGPSLALVLGYFSATAYHFVTERKQNTVIRGMFSHYVSGALVNELISNPDKLRLGGDKKELTILFCDMAGFTTFSENKDPEELVKYINEFLSEMTEIILDHKGTLDKYLGDAIMAFWGAPIDIKDHQLLACKTALLMQERIALLGKRWSATGDNKISIRIGINSGDVVVGNMGGKNRFDYTVMGDSVNLASRLEGANKQYGTGTMLSDSTYSAVKDFVMVRELDTIRVKGKKLPTTVYELIGLKEDEKANEKIKQLENYFEGLKNYKIRNFAEAKKCFQKCNDLLNEDPPSKVYIERCQIYIQNPPDENWDGVFVMTSK
ncbi:MAG: adenylate/guanylate cyclase domain-containing protein [Melioribacteraceae bacterium]|nr:MAG: adenylate/guanylate cyclase domain-containing protein [Melioribacteraceae bacterium]